MLGWDSPLRAVAGSRSTKLVKGLGIETVGQLLQHYPRAFIPRGQTSDAGDFVDGEYQTMIAEVRSSDVRPYKDRRTGRLAFRVVVTALVGDTPVQMTFFDKRQHTADWRVGVLHPGATVMFAGKVGWSRRSGGWELIHPTYDEVDPDRAADALAQLSPLRPIYPATKSVTSWELERVVAVALDMLGDDVPELLSDQVRQDAGLLQFRTALEHIHRPSTVAEHQAALARLKLDEALVAQTVLARRRLLLEHQSAVPRVGSAGGLLDAFDQRIPFTLTRGQREVGDAILGDLARDRPMHRLLQGEVGSGKTVVALRAMLRVVDSGGQAVLLAPTEVLAQQHVRSITSMLGDLAGAGTLGAADQATSVTLLTGSLGAAARREALLDVASGAAGIVVGTHALLQDAVEFADLGLLVVDEQHRFGVEQRAALTDRAGDRPHVLVMTATPIPRTIAMTVFGDLDVSSLIELPAGRAPIQTTVVPLGEHPAWGGRIWERLAEEVGKGHQAYVVCPRISGGRSDDTLDQTEPVSGPEPTRAGVEPLYEELAAGPLAGLRVAVLHGRLPSEEKDSVMRRFAAGDLDVLVSTTVIEVGVDVANATAMVVMDADAFGVSQLHQLRGRVGRGGHPGLCLLVTSTDPGSPARRRLEAVASTVDGVALSQIDLEQRREGDVLGTSQSGSHSTLRLLSVLRDEQVIQQARDLASDIVARDPHLVEHPDLATAVTALEDSTLVEFLDKT